MNRSIPTLASSLFSLGKLGFLGKMPPVSLHSSVNSSVSRHLVRFPPPSGSWRPDRVNGFRPTSHRLLAMKKKTIDTNRYRLFRKGAYGTYYIEDTVTHRQTSLKTTDKAEATRLWQAKNEAADSPDLSFRVGVAYLGAADPDAATRTCATVIATYAATHPEGSSTRL